MDKVALVSPEIERGALLIDTLESAKIKVAVALWAYLSEFEDWRLVLSARQFDSFGIRDAYGLLHESLAGAGFTPRTTPRVMILPMTDPFVKELRRVFGKTKSVEGMRLGGQMFGDRFVQDAYVYRIS